MSAQMLSIDWDIKYILKNILKEYDMAKEHQTNLVEVIQLILQGEKEHSLAKWEQAYQRLLCLNEINTKSTAESEQQIALEKNYKRVISYILGLCYQFAWKKQRSEQDGKSAFEIFANLAATNAFVPAHYSQGLCWEMGLGCVKDLKKAYQAYSIAKVGSPRGIIAGVFLYKFGSCQEHVKTYTGSSNIVNGESHIDYYQRAAGQDPKAKHLGIGAQPHPRAIRALGIQYLTMHRPGRDSYHHDDYQRGLQLLIEANKELGRCEQETCLVSETKEKQEKVSVSETKEKQEKMSMRSSNTGPQNQKEEVLVWDALIRDAGPTQPKTSGQVLILDLDPKDQEIAAQPLLERGSPRLRTMTEKHMDLATRLLTAQRALDPMDTDLSVGRLHAWSHLILDSRKPVLAYFALDRCQQFPNSGEVPRLTMFKIGFTMPDLKQKIVDAVVEQCVKECSEAMQQHCSERVLPPPLLQLTFAYSGLKEEITQNLTRPVLPRPTNADVRRDGVGYRNMWFSLT